MKTFLVIVAVLLSLNVCSAQFFGNDPSIVQKKTLTESINKCQKAVGNVTTFLCNTIKTTLKFNIEKYKAAANSLTDLEYLFTDIQQFYSNFLNCLNEQNGTVTAITTIRNLEILEYQLDLFVITAIEQKFQSSADVLGQVFGEKTTEVISSISETFRSEFSKIKDNISVIKTSFQAIADSGTEVTVASINATLSDSAFVEMIASFELIKTKSEQISEVFSNFVAVTATLEKITESVQSKQSNSTAMITKADYTLDITIQASKKLFTNATLTIEATIDDSFASFYQIAALQFTGDEDLQKTRSDVEDLVVSIINEFEILSENFSDMFTKSFAIMTEQIGRLRKTVSEKVTEVTDYLAEAVSDSSGSYSKCLASGSDNAKMATNLIDALGFNSSLCIAKETNVSMIAQSLMTFIGEDVALNLNGTADRLCGCAVKGDKKVEKRSKRCFERGIANLTMQIDDDRAYLNEEYEMIKTTVDQSSTVFLECSDNVTKIFDESFEKFKSAIKACAAV